GEAPAVARNGLPDETLRTERPWVATDDVLHEQAKRSTVLSGIEDDMTAVGQPGGPLKRSNARSSRRVVESRTCEIPGFAGAGRQHDKAETVERRRQNQRPRAVGRKCKGTALAQANRGSAVGGPQVGELRGSDSGPCFTEQHAATVACQISGNRLAEPGKGTL